MWWFATGCSPLICCLVAAPVAAGQETMQPKTPSPAKMERNVAAEKLNPFYLGISAALLNDDRQRLAEYEKELHKSASSQDQAVQIAAMGTRLYVLVALEDRDAFMQGLGALCSVLAGDSGVSGEQLRFVKMANQKVKEGKAAKWFNESIEHAYAATAPESDRLFIYLAGMQMQVLGHYPYKAEFLTKALEKVSKSLAGLAKDDPLRSRLNETLEELRYFSIQNHSSALKVPALRSEVAAYLTEYGKDGRRAQQSFLLLLQALNGQQSERALKAYERPDEAWLEKWKVAIAAKETIPWTKRIDSEWTKLRTTKPPPDDLKWMLRNDKRLQATLTMVLKKPSVEEIINRLQSATAVSLVVDPKLNRKGPAFEGTNMVDQPAWMFMEHLEKTLYIDGHWDKTKDGYFLTGKTVRHPPETKKTTPPTETSSPWRTAMAIASVTLGLLVGVLWFVRRKRLKGRNQKPPAS